MTLKFPKGCTRVEATRLSLELFDRIAETNLAKLENSLVTQAPEHGWSAAHIAALLDEAREQWRAERADHLRQLQGVFTEIIAH